MSLYEVNHKKYGKGVVIKIDDEHIIVKFKNKRKVFLTKGFDNFFEFTDKELKSFIDHVNLKSTDVLIENNTKNNTTTSIGTLLDPRSQNIDIKNTNQMSEDELQKTLNNSWKDVEEEKNLTKENIKNKNDFSKEIINDKYDDNNIVHIENKGVNKMKCYLGFIEKKSTNNYYNFKPICSFEDQKLLGLNKEYLENDIFPTKGLLNLSYKLIRTNSLSQKFLDSLNLKYSKEDYNCKIKYDLYAVLFNDNEIEKNDYDGIQKKLDIQKIIDNGINLNSRIQPLNQLSLYKVVKPVEDINNDSFLDIIDVKEKYAEQEQVLLQYNNGFCGPYSLKVKSDSDECYIKLDVNNNKYLLNYYKSNDNCVIHELNIDDVYEKIVLLTDKPKIIDVVPDKILIDKVKDNINLDLFKENIEEFEYQLSNSTFISDIPNEFIKSRINRVKEIFNNVDDLAEEKKAVIKSLIDTENSDILNLLRDKFVESDLVKAKDDRIRDLSEDVDKYDKKIKELEQLKADLENTISEIKNSSDADKTVDKVIVEEKDKIISDLRNKLENYENYENLKTEYMILKSKRDDLINENTDFSNQNTKLKGDREKIHNEFKASIDNTIKSLTESVNQSFQKAFDPYIANILTKKANEWSTNVEYQNYNQIAQYMCEEFNCSEYTDRDELIDMLVNGIKKFRNYSKNEILNMLICISQNFLTIFAGEPGTGKTSICDIIADSLGLRTFKSNDNPSLEKINLNRYVPVSVERGWTSKRDLIGYYNPLTQKYDRTNSKIYDSLMILNSEREKSKYPFIILLDEANLSQMEYYWADFMKAADKNNYGVYVNIGLKDDVYIPETLHFLATINTDQTTERLSPRLIDRTWIIKLPELDDKHKIIETSEDIHQVFINPICWNDIKKAFINYENREVALKVELEKIYKLFTDVGLTISPRIRLSIRNYICVAQEIMENESGGISRKEKALDYAITQKLLPKINGQYSTYKKLFDELKIICDTSHLNMTKKALDKMQEAAEQNMGYCEYLI